MKDEFTDLRSIDFATLSEVKAKLSEFVRRLSGGKRLAVTTNGRPSAVILSYADFLELIGTPGSSPGTDQGKVIDFDEWEKGRPTRKAVRESLRRVFNPSKLSRKGQKYYKKKTVESFNGTTQSRAR